MIGLNVCFSKILILLVLNSFCAFGVLKTQSQNIGNQSNQVSKDSSWYRLPEYVKPDFYELWIFPQLAVNNFTYEGRVKIKLQVMNETNFLIVHVDGLHIDSEKSEIHEINNGTISDVLISNTEIDTERQFYIISLANTISPGNYSISLSFVGQVLDDVLGFYRSSYKSGDKERWLGVTQFSTTFARRAFPCLDEPYLKATYQLHIGHYGNETVIGNTIAENSIEIKPDYYLTTFAKTPPMSTYLVGWAIHDFKYAAVSNFTDFGMWTRETMNNHSSRALEEGKKIYDLLYNWINIENPVKKMEQVAVPDFYFHAMENWGMVTFRESVVLWEDGVTPTISIRDGLSTIAHEYAHTWFGNLVTPKFWDVAWLKEGFATFFGYYSLSLVHGDWKIMDLFGIEVLQPALLDDSFEHNRTMNGKNIGQPKSILASMDFVAYKKGASIIRMIKHVIGDRAFQSGLQSYIKNLAKNYATPSLLYKHLQTFADQDTVLQKGIQIHDVVESWANQAGFPLVTVTRNYSYDTIEVSQERFYLNRSQDDANPNHSRWWIPLNVAMAADDTEYVVTNTTTWIRPEDKRILMLIEKNQDSILCNFDQFYYYRVNYDEVNWKRLTHRLNSVNFATISAVNRASLLDDSFNLARAGYLDYFVPLNLSRYLSQEFEYEPWVAATKSFEFLNIMLSGLPDIHRQFQAHVNGLIQPVYENVTFVDNPSDEFRTKLLRNLILSTACSMNNSNCISTANSLFQGWLANRGNIIHPNAKSSVYCSGIRSTGSENWWKLLDIFLKSDLHTERELLIDGLGCTNDSNIIIEFLNYTLHEDSVIRKQFRLAIFNSVLNGNPKNVEYALDYIAANLDRIIAKRGATFLTKIFDALKKRIVLRDQLQKLKDLVENNIGLLGVSITDARKAIKFSEENITWIKKYGPRIAKWLN